MSKYAYQLGQLYAVHHGMNKQAALSGSAWRGIKALARGLKGGAIGAAKGGVSGGISGGRRVGDLAARKSFRYAGEVADQTWAETLHRGAGSAIGSAGGGFGGAVTGGAKGAYEGVVSSLKGRPMNIPFKPPRLRTEGVTGGKALAENAGIGIGMPAGVLAASGLGFHGLASAYKGVTGNPLIELRKHQGPEAYDKPKNITRSPFVLPRTRMMQLDEKRK